MGCDSAHDMSKPASIVSKRLALLLPTSWA
jgi:hypothetical protein